MIIVIPSNPGSRPALLGENEAPGCLTSLARKALRVDAASRVILVLGQGETAPPVDDPRLAIIADGRCPAVSDECSVIPGADRALALAREAGLLGQEPVLVLNPLKDAPEADVATALERFASSGADALASVIVSRDHPCQLQAPVEVLGRCVVVMREPSCSAAGPLPEGQIVSRPFAFNWDWSMVNPQEETDLFEQVQDPRATSYRMAAGARSVPPHAALWLRQGAGLARIVSGWGEAADLLPAGRGPGDILGWSVPSLSEGLAAVVTGENGAWTLRARLKKKSGDHVRLLAQPLPEDRGAQAALIDAPVEAEKGDVAMTLAPCDCVIMLVSLVQPASGQTCDVMLPYMPDRELWGHHPESGACVQVGDGSPITGRQDFPEVLEPDGSFLVLGPGIRSVEDAFASERLAYHILPGQEDETRQFPEPPSQARGARILPAGAAEGLPHGAPSVRDHLVRILREGAPEPGAALTRLKQWCAELARLAERDRIVHHLLMSRPTGAPGTARLFRRDPASLTARALSAKGPVLQALRGLPASTHFLEILEIADLILWACPADDDVNALLASMKLPEDLRPLLDDFRGRRGLVLRGSIRHESMRSPFGLAFDPATGSLAASNEQKGTVSLFGPEGRFLREVRHPGRLSVGLAYDSDGALWVATATPDRDNLFFSDPAIDAWSAVACSELTPDAHIPWFVCEHGGRVYVQLSTSTPYNQSRVVSFRKDDPEGSLLVSEKRMGMPGGITAHGDRLLVAQRVPAALWLMDPDCSGLRPMAGFGPWEQILGVQSDGRFIYLSTLFSLVKTDDSGRVIYSADVSSLRIDRPAGIALGAGSDLFLAGYAGNAVNRYAVAP